MRTSEKFWNILAPIYANLRQNPVSGYFLKKENQAFKTLMEELVPSEIRTICDLGVGRGPALGSRCPFPTSTAINIPHYGI